MYYENQTTITGGILMNHKAMKEIFFERIMHDISMYDPVKKNKKYPKSGPIECWMIYLDGIPLTIKSGKSMWKRIGHAKSALRCSLKGFEYAVPYKKGDWKERREAGEEAYQKMLNCGQVEFRNILVQESLMNKSYSWEELQDIEQDVWYAMDSISREFKGTIQVTVTYNKENK